MVKTEKLTTVSEVIDAFGGTTITATRYGVLPSAVSNWRTSGRFPARLHYRVSQDTAVLGLTIDHAALFEPPETEAA